MTEHYDIAIDFMDMTAAGRLWSRALDVRDRFQPAVGEHVIVGDEGADPAVARVVAIDEKGNVELEVLPGSVDSHRDLLARA